MIILRNIIQSYRKLCLTRDDNVLVRDDFNCVDIEWNIKGCKKAASTLTIFGWDKEALYDSSREHSSAE